MTLRADDVREDAAVHKPAGVSPASVMRAPGRSGGNSRITSRVIGASAPKQVERADDRMNVRIDARAPEPVAAYSVRSALRIRAEVPGAPSSSLTQPLTGYHHLNASVFHLHGEAYGPGARYAGTGREPDALGGARSHSILQEEEYGPC